MPIRTARRAAAGSLFRGERGLGDDLSGARVAEEVRRCRRGRTEAVRRRRPTASTTDGEH
ncbi:hypothetical protein [Rathayibacter rathayi]|uniref:hypothetical protein n=1 Tax=Rathayibacter rathayi TaxID=33887 RepID=UPI0011B0A67D|nr:hypothetical protein [Rathayibacter rathayi]